MVCYLSSQFVKPTELENAVAQKTMVVLEDDLEGGAADENVSFSLDGVSYQIDLNKKNAAKLRDALAPYVAAARKSGTRRRAGRPAARAARGGQTATIREWAKKKGLPVSDRGRIPADIVAAYEKAQRAS